MNGRDRNGEGRRHPDRDNGEPIGLLATFVEPVEAGFLGRLRNRIHRRELAGEVVRLGWHAPYAVLMEFVTMIFGLLSGVDENRTEGGEQ